MPFGQDSDSTQRFRRGDQRCASVPALACMEEKIVETREAPSVAARDRQPDSGDGLAWAAWGGGEARSSEEAG